MSLENEDEGFATQASKSIEESEKTESEKKPRISYSRDFLLSLSDLEICRRLPSGFDQSVLSEFEENSIHERHRSGSLPLQGFRRNDYSSSPPTRGDSSNFSRGGYGRWDNRSSGWSDKDGDSQSADLDPDSGRRNYGNQSRRPWQNSEHDGLLGSGSFPRPSGFTAGTSAPKAQTNEPYHLNRSNEAYQPPRPFKAVAHSRPNTHDSFNDETFGSSESTSQDRAEEERKRRASFELMRKEQQKVLQEKQKTIGNKHKSDGFTDLVLKETKEEELNSAVQSVPKDDFGKSSILLQSLKARPLVPPGFKSTIVEKSSNTKPIASTDKENPKPGIEEIHLLAKGNQTQNGTLGNIPVHKLDMTGQYLQDKNVGGVHEAVDGEVFGLVTNKSMGNKILSNSCQESTTSVLGNFLGNTPTTKDGVSTVFLEQKSKPDGPLSPHNVQSSKFAQWFNEDEKKPVDDLLSSRPNDLLSLIGGGDKPVSQIPNIISTEPIAPELPYTGFGVTKSPPDLKHLYNSFRQESAPPVAAVLTCEDLEQTILSEYSEKSSTNLQPPVPDWTVSGQDNVPATPVDNHATHHLLSLLQKGTAVDDTSNTKFVSVENHPISEKPKDGNQEGGSGQNLSLEALFGSAFMKELQSGQAPVSAQRGSAGSARVDLFESREIGPDLTNYESNILSSKQKQPVKSDDAERWLKFDGQRVDDVDPLEFQRGVPKVGEIQLPEEESLITVGDPANPMPVHADVAFDISEKLAVLNSGFRGGERSSMVRGPAYEMLEPERQFNNQMHAAAAAAAQMNLNRRPMLHPLDPMNSQMRFQEHLMQRDSLLNHQQFPPNMARPFHHPPDATRVSGFDVPVHPQMLPQMRMQANFPSPHMLREFQRPSSLMAAEREAAGIRGFPFAHQQTNIGMPLPPVVADGSSGSNHPEAFQRMLEMELRAQSKQVRPVNAAGAHNQAMYGHELDMGFRFR